MRIGTRVRTRVAIPGWAPEGTVGLVDEADGTGVMVAAELPGRPKRRRFGEAEFGELEVLAGASCGVPWAVCPHCPGEGLGVSAGVAWCPTCGQRWPVDAVEPCPWPAEETLADGAGAARVCLSHARHPSAAGLQRRSH